MDTTSSEELWDKLMQIRKEFFEKYKTPTPQQKKPHIKLADFLRLIDERKLWKG
jgi:hypothetical protein